MGDAGAFLAIALGVFVAVLYPIVRGKIRKEFPPVAGVAIPPWVKRYGLLFLFSLLTAFVLLAVYRGANADAELQFWPSVVMGFGWEAIVEKLWPTKSQGVPRTVTNETPGG